MDYVKIKIRLDDRSKIATAFGYAITYLALRDKDASMALAEAACRVNGADCELVKKMNEEKPKTGRCEFDIKRQLWIVFNGKEWVEVDLKKHYCNFKNDKNIN